MSFEIKPAGKAAETGDAADSGAFSLSPAAQDRTIVLKDFLVYKPGAGCGNVVDMSLKALMNEIADTDVRASLLKCIKTRTSLHGAILQFENCNEEMITRVDFFRGHLASNYPDLLYFLEREYFRLANGKRKQRVTGRILLERVKMKLDILKHLDRMIENKGMSLKEELEFQGGSGVKEEARVYAPETVMPPRSDMQQATHRTKRGKARGFTNTISDYKRDLFLKIIDFLERNECTEAHACRQVCKMKKFAEEDAHRIQNQFNFHKNKRGGTLSDLRFFLNGGG